MAPPSKAGRWLPDAVPPHHCDLPMMMFRRLGRRWQCGECGQKWEIDNFMDFKDWRRIA